MTKARVLWLINMAHLAIAAVVLLLPVSVYPASKVCRLFVAPALLNQAKSLKGHDFQVFQLKDDLSLTGLSELYDLAVIPGWQNHLSLWMKVHSGEAEEIGVLTVDDLKALPRCSGIKTLAGIGYSRVIFGSEARRRLDTFYMNKTSSYGMGDLILQAEALNRFGFDAFQAKVKPLRDKYQNLVNALRQLWITNKKEPYFKRITALRYLLYPYFRHYHRESASLLDMIGENPQGNCVANTKLITSALVDAQIDFGPDWKLAVQSFQDHVQPMLIHVKSGRLINLISGAWDHTPGNVYSPELLSFWIARKAGRTTDGEAAFLLRSKSVPIYKMDLSLGLRSFLQIPGDLSGSADGPREIFAFHNEESYYAKGLTPPEDDEMDFNDTGSLTAGPGNLWKSKRSPRDKKSLRARFNPRCLTAGKPTDKTALEKINQIVWQTVDQKDRPPLEDQMIFTCDILPSEPSAASPGRASVVYSLPRARIAASQELSLINPLVEFGLKSSDQTHEGETVNVNGAILVLAPLNVDVLFSSQRKKADWLEEDYTKIYQNDEWSKKLYDAITLKLGQVRVSEIVKVLNDWKSLFKEPYGDLLVGFANYADLSRFMELASSYKITKDLPFMGVNPICPISQAIRSLTAEFGRDSGAVLKFIDKQDPVGQLRFFRFMAEVSHIWLKINRSVFCGLDNDQRRFDPISPLLTYVLMRSLSSDVSPLTILPPRTVTEVTLVETMEKWQPQNLQERKGQRPAESHPFEVLEARATEVKTKRESPSANRFEMRTETLVGLLMGISAGTARHPLVQAFTAGWWSEEAHSYFKKAWLDWHPSGEKLVQLFTWSPILLFEDWMPPGVRRIFSKSKNPPGNYLFVTEKDGERLMARVPDYMKLEISDQLTFENKNFRWTGESPPRPQVITLDRNAPTFNDGNCLLGDYILDGQVDQLSHLSPQERDQNASHRWFGSSFFWRAEGRCIINYLRDAPILKEELNFNIQTQAGGPLIMVSIQYDKPLNVLLFSRITKPANEVNFTQQVIPAD